MNDNDPSPDDTFDPDELDAAVNDRAPALPDPETDVRTKLITAWDEPPASTGTSAPKFPPDDEATIASDLVDEGLDIADSEQRIASADPDSE